MARPAKELKVTEELIAQLASVGCTDEEIALMCSIGETTLQRDFGALLKKARSNLRSNLRTAQVRKALGHYYEKADKDGVIQVYTAPPDNTMLIWLGKQYLAQSDKSEIKDTTDPINWSKVPDTVREAFLAGSISIDDVRRSEQK